MKGGRRAKAIKAISLAEDHLHDHFPGYPIMPNALVIEGVAQTGGLLVCEHGGFAEKVVLAKIGKAVFFGSALPGDVLTYTAEVEYIKKGRGHGHRHGPSRRRCCSPRWSWCSPI